MRKITDELQAEIDLLGFVQTNLLEANIDPAFLIEIGSDVSIVVSPPTNTEKLAGLLNNVNDNDDESVNDNGDVGTYDYMSRWNILR